MCKPRSSRLDQHADPAHQRDHGLQAPAGHDPADEAGLAPQHLPPCEHRRTNVSPPELFAPLGPSYERAGALLSLGLERGWRRRLVDRAAPRAGERILDVATGTGLVARALRDRAGCVVTGIDVTAGMIAAADRHDGVRYVVGAAERLPFADATFDALTFTYLLRYVEDPAATMRELARVVRPGGRIAMLEFARPRSALLRAGWWLYTRLALPVLGRAISSDWRRVGAFLGPSIDRFHARHPTGSLALLWRAAGIEDVHRDELGLGSAIVMSGTKRVLDDRRASALLPDASVPAADRRPPARPAFYALSPGSWRDAVNLLHLPYTAWHLSYVVLGAALAPTVRLDHLAGTLLAFFLALGIGVHALDELRARPLGTRVPRVALVALGALGLGGSVALGVAGTTVLGPGLWPLIAVGIVLALAYPLELAGGRLHSDLWFTLGWGAFPLLTSYWVQAGTLDAAAALGAAYAIALSYAQRRLSTWVRGIRRRADQVSGEVRYSDGSRVALDRETLIAGPEAALRWLTLAAVAVALAALALRV